MKRRRTGMNIPIHIDVRMKEESVHAVYVTVESCQVQRSTSEYVLLIH
jgi:hypothetical protein